MKYALVAICVAVCASCAPGPEKAAFVTTLGSDTLAVEAISHAPQLMVARVLLRTPTTRLFRYELETSVAGDLVRFEAAVYDPVNPDVPVGRETATLKGDSLVLTADNADPVSVAAHGSVLPFLDMIHWPFELMLTRAHSAGVDSVVQDLFSGSRVMPFVVRRLSADSMTVTHPFRGTMGVRTDEAGRLLLLDASATTRKLRVVRTFGADLDALAVRYAALDRAGQSFGALSGRGSAEASVRGAVIAVDFGTPSKRRRTIFGELVPYGERWRMGANRATHLATSHGLSFGSLRIPAGEYTLSMIPDPDSSLLIINTQTGQGGTTYDASLDLGRVALLTGMLEVPVEDFLISIEETEAGGVLQFDWDTTRLSASFTVDE